MAWYFVKHRDNFTKTLLIPILLRKPSSQSKILYGSRLQTCHEFRTNFTSLCVFECTNMVANVKTV
jgi:hypothetical protein